MVVALLLVAGASGATLAPAGTANLRAAPAPAPTANPCAPQPTTASLAAAISRVGAVDLYFFGAAGAQVSYFECVGERAFALGQRSSQPNSNTTALLPATFWRCGRLVRHFAATATLADGSFARGTTSVRTMSCAHRFALEVPARVAEGRRATVRIVDRWRIGGVRTRLCVIAPRDTRSCDSVVFATVARSATRHFRATQRGHWRVELLVDGHPTRASVAVGVASVAVTAPPPTVLATGDSMMEGVDSFLSDDLGDSATVVSDVRPGFAISEANAWQPIAVAQVARLRPAQTVVAIGANEGFPMRGTDGTTHACCDAGWVDEYVRRVRKTMVTYRRQGRGRVFWLTVPAPKDPRRVPTFDAVNTAIVRAAQGLAGVRVLRMDLLFSPSGYSESIRYHGKNVPVREPDGIHLNVAGTRIAAAVVAHALRAR